jgi:hypothetical protein
MALFGKYGQLFYQNNLKEKDCWRAETVKAFFTP